MTKYGNESNDKGSREEVKDEGRQEEREQNASIFEMCKSTELSKEASEQQVATAERGNHTVYVNNLK